jgi:MFS family permease
MSEAVASGEARAASGAVRRALRNRRFRTLASAIAVSELGTWTYEIAYVAYIYAATHSTAWVAAATIAKLVPGVVLSPIGGALADRSDRRLLMMASDVVRGGLMLGLAAVAAAHGASLLLIAIGTVAVAAGQGYGPSTNAELPLVLGEEDLAAGNTIIGFIWNITMFLGPAVSGALLALTSPTVAFLANAASFFVSAALIAVALPSRRPAEAAETEEHPSLFADSIHGARVLLGEPARRAVTLVCLSDYFVFGALAILLVTVSNDQLHAGGRGIGVLFAAFGIGGTLAAVTATKVADSARGASSLFLASVVTCGAMCVLSVVPTTPLAALLVAVAGIASNTVDVSGMTVLQRVTPQNVLGRVFGAFEALNYVVTLAGNLTAPLLVGIFGLRASLLCIGIGIPLLDALLLRDLRIADSANAAAASGLRSRVQLLARTPLLVAAPTSAVERLAAAARAMTAPAGTVVVREGDPADDVYVVVEGRLRVTVRGRSGVVRRLGIGEVFGEIGVISSGPRTASVTSDTAVHLLRIPGAVFVDCVQAAPPLEKTVGGLVATRLSTRRRGDDTAAPTVAVTT